MGIYFGCVGLGARLVCVYVRCVGAYSMLLGVLPGFKVYLNVSASETDSNILRHAYKRVQTVKG